MIVPQRQPGKFRAVVTGAATSSVAAVQKSGATDDRSWQLGILVRTAVGSLVAQW